MCTFAVGWRHLTAVMLAALSAAPVPSLLLTVAARALAQVAHVMEMTSPRPLPGDARAMEEMRAATHLQATTVSPTLREFLAKVRLDAYHSALVILGVVDVDDIVAADAADLASTGMKALEVKRASRYAAEVVAQAAPPRGSLRASGSPAQARASGSALIQAPAMRGSLRSNGSATGLADEVVVTAAVRSRWR